MPISRANGLDIHYEVAGSGPPLLMLHALPFDHNLWLFQVGRFSSRFTTVAVDLRGWGRSEKPVTPFTLRDMGDDALGVLNDLGFYGPSVVLGCSIGSKIAATLACEIPERVSAAVLIGGNLGHQDFSRRIADYRQQAKDGTLKAFHLGHLRHGVTGAWAQTALGRYLLDGFAERGEGLDAESIAQVFAALQGADLSTRLPKCEVPALVVNGEFDSARAGGELTASLMPNAEHRLIPGAGHCCFLEDPETFDSHMQDFLRRQGLWPDP
ncbi:MAG: alpha/beta hydrolase [Beijerinckiaceae bacterium]|nr:alpha/beta hydrolase [Beijerinckiaceae bacterium]